MVITFEVSMVFNEKLMEELARDVNACDKINWPLLKMYAGEVGNVRLCDVI